MIKHINFHQMSSFTFVNIMNSAMIINTFNSDNCNIANIKTQNVRSGQPLQTEFKHLIKILIMEDNTFYVTFCRINSFP